MDVLRDKMIPLPDAVASGGDDRRWACLRYDLSREWNHSDCNIQREEAV